MKNKLKLEDLKVQSFVTNLDEKYMQTLKGGLEIGIEIGIYGIIDPPTYAKGCSTRCPKQ